MKTRILFTVILVMVAAMTVAPEVSAQEQGEEYTLEEITVTATKRESALEDTALAISVVTGDQINEQGRNDIYDLLKDIPGLMMNGTENLVFNIRGIGGFVPSFHSDPSVAMNIDGAYTSSLVSQGGDLVFYDVARVELLRGPQGTLYGRNAEGGVLNLISNDPSDTSEASGTIELGSYHLLRGTGMVNAPLTDNTALRIAFHYQDRDAYSTSGDDKLDSASGRVKYLYQPSDELRLLVGGEFSKGGRAFFSETALYGAGDSPLADPYDNVTKDGGLTGMIPGDTSDQRTAKLWAQFDWKTPIGTVTYLPSYNEGGWESTSVSLETRGVPDVYKQSVGEGKDHQTSFELRLASSGESAFDYVLGVFYLDAENSQWSLLTGQVIDSLRVVGQTSEAVFGQGTYDLTDRFRGTLGLRYTKDNKDYYNANPWFGIGEPASGANNWTHTDWRVGVEMNILEDSLAYASVATGYRPGAVNIMASTKAFDLEGNVVTNPGVFTESEELLAYEMGAKTSFLNRRLTLNVDVYYYDYENRQYTEVWNGVPQDQLCPSGVAPTADPRLPGGLGICFTDRNLGKVETYGGELSTKWLPTDNDSIDFSLSYLSATVAESQEVLVDPSGSFMDVNGQTMPDSPKWTINAGYEHRFDFKPGSLFLRADGRYTSESYFEGFAYLSSRMVTERLFGTGFSYSARDIYTCKAHYVYDFTATYLMGDGKYRISTYVKNITEEYWKRYTGDNDVSISVPRTYGVTFTASF